MCFVYCTCILSLTSWLLGQDPYGQAQCTSISGNSVSLLLVWIWFVARTAIFLSIYPGFPSRLQLMTMNKLPRAWWKLFSSERSTHALPTIASREQHPSTCAACGIKSGTLRMRCTQVNILLKMFSYILKNLNIIWKYRIKPRHCCSKGKLHFCDLFWLSL